MAETKNIATMAENFADDLAKFTGWTKVGPRDMNWDCIQPHHGKSTHPTDAVYSYHDPYDGLYTQILFDFKSLAKTSIKPSSISTALKNMAMSLDCAVVSDKFKSYYPVPHDEEKKLLACLFVYNHDHQYKKTIGSHISQELKKNWPPLQNNHEIILLDPKILIYLTSISTDFFGFIAKNRFDIKKTGFVQPDLQLPYHRKTCSTLYGAPMTLEQTTSPFHTLRYQDKDKENYIMYSRSCGESSDEFLLLFDYLIIYQILDRAGEISIRLPNAVEEAFPNFEKAKQEYADIVTTTNDIAEQVRERLDTIKLSKINHVRSEFLETDIGMQS